MGPGDVRSVAALPHDRLAGCLLAGAAGDCLGGPFEGLGPDPRRQPTDGPWLLSDDTVLTLATTRAIVAAGAVDPARIAEAYVAAWRRGLPGAGSSTLKALRDLAAGQHWALAGAQGEFAAGSGAAMRVAPLAFVATLETPGFARRLREVASVTHRHDEAIAGAVAVVHAMQTLASEARGAPRSDLLARVAAVLPDTRVADTLRALAALPASATAADAAARSGTSGHAAEVVPLAIFIAASSRTDLASGLLAAIRCGGDTDTLGSLVGHLLGGCGLALPPEWLARVPCRDEVDELATQWAQREASPGALWRASQTGAAAPVPRWTRWLARGVGRVHRWMKRGGREGAGPRRRR